MRHLAYLDTEGHPTIGVGFNLDRADARERLAAVDANYDSVRNGTESLSDSQIDALFDADVRAAQDSARDLVSNFDDLSDARQDVVTDMVFNMGADTFATFERTIEAVENGDWETVAAEMLDSVWAMEVGNRAQEDADLMESGDEES